MYKLKTIFVVSAVLFLAGCIVPSLHPLFTDKEIVFEPELIGSWEQNDTEKPAIWIFDKLGENYYQLTINDGESSDKFVVHLVQLENFFFLDFYPKDLPNAGFVIPVHIFYKIWFEENSFRIAILNKDWFEDMIKKGEIDIAYERLEGDEIIFTASTKELQEFVLEYAEEGTAFSELATFHRMIKEDNN